MAVDVEFLNGNNVNNINNNFQRVKDALQEAVGRNGNLPNHMNADLDMNSNDILNVESIDLQRIVLNGEEFDPRQMRGWAPVFSAIEYNGTVVMMLIDYVGGQGIKPTQYIGWYIGSTGYVQDINQATGFGSSGVTDGDKGDITVSNSGTVWDLNKNFDTVSELLSDESMGYLGSGSPTTVSDGDIVTAQGFRYEVAADDADDEWLVETAGGVKLYPLRNPTGSIIIDQYGAPANGVDSDSDAIDKAVAHAEFIYETFNYPYTPPLVWFSGADYAISRPIFTKHPLVFDGARSRITALSGFTGRTVPLEAGGTEILKSMVIFLNGNKGSISGTLRWGAQVGRGLILYCAEEANVGVYIERMPYSYINCEIQHPSGDGLVVGPFCWGLNADDIVIENHSAHGIHFETNSSANGASIRNPKIWGEFKTGTSGIFFDLDAECHGVVVDGGFIESVSYGVLLLPGNGPITITISFEKCLQNVRAAGVGDPIGPITIRGSLLNAEGGASKLYADNAYFIVDGCQFLDTVGLPTVDVETTATGTIELRRNLYSGGAPAIAAESRIVGMDLRHDGDRQVVAPYTDYDADLGSASKRFRRGYFQNMSIFPPASVTPATNGEVTFELNSNTVLNVKVRGSDGIVRSAVISLA